MNYIKTSQKFITYFSFLLLIAGLAGCDGTTGNSPSGLPGTSDPVLEEESPVPPVFGGSSGDGGSQHEDPPPPATSDWYLIILASVPDLSTDSGTAKRYLTAGQKSAATDEFDFAFDLPALPGGSLNAFFNHSGEAGYDSDLNQDTLWVDYRAPGFPKDWDIDIEAPAGKDLTLTWILPSGDVSCATHSFHLEDLDGDLPLTDLCVAGSLVYPADGLGRNFLLKASLKI